MKKTKRIIVISIIIVAILVLAFLWTFFNTDIFRTKRGAFNRYFATISEVLDIFDEKDDTLSNYKTKKESTPYIRKATATIESSSNIANSNILDKIKFTVTEKTDVQNEKSNIELGILNSKDEIETISAIKEKDVYGIKCQDIVTGYVCVKNEGISRILGDLGFENNVVADEINDINISKVLETTKVEKSKLESLNEIVKNNVSAKAYSKEKRNKVKINDKTYSTTAYSITLSEEEHASLQIKLLSKISQDSILMDYITSKLKLLNLNDQYTSINSLNSLLKDRINQLKETPSAANTLKITVHEYKQKNIKTEIEIGDTKLEITHLTSAETEISSIKINDKEYSLEKSEGKYIIGYSNEQDNGLTFKIEYNQTGSIENNDIKNYMTINKKEGIKSITIKYEDTINFTNDIGAIKDFTNENKAILNDYTDDEIKEFIQSLKDKINQVYVNKGASIGINLDPIFEND